LQIEKHWYWAVLPAKMAKWWR